MAYTGKTYKHEKDDNFDAFVASLGLPADRVGDAKNYKPSQKLVKDGDSYKLVTCLPTGEKELSFKPGVAVVEDVIGGFKSNTTFSVDGNTITQVQKFDDGRTLTFKREYSEDKLVVTITSSSWDGTAYRYYKAD